MQVGIYIDQWYSEDDGYVPSCVAGPFDTEHEAQAWADERDYPLNENAYYIAPYEGEG